MKTSIVNLWYFLTSLVLMTLKHVPGWRYPSTRFNLTGLNFERHSERVEVIGYQTIKNSAAFNVIKKLKGPLVFVVAVKDGMLQLNAHVLVEDDGQQDLLHPYQSVNGTVDQFIYLLNKGELYHAMRPTSITRNMGYLHYDPVFSITIPMNTTDRKHIHTLLLEEPSGLNDLSVIVEEKGGYEKQVFLLDGVEIGHSVRLSSLLF